MTQLACWVIFPAVLLILSLGCGLLLERAAGFALPEPLVLPGGLAVITVLGELPTKLSATAALTTPAIVILALLGLALGRPWRRRPRLGRWPLLSALAVYLFYLAPVLLTGDPTFTGYIKLDDTATWMAMTDWVLSHGHTLSGLPPSTFETTLSAYLNGGEPVGALLPWGIGHRLVGQDLAWVFQPYLALLGAMVSLSLWPIAGQLIRSRALRALVVFVAAQSALLYGYSLWGGVKELAAAWVFPLTVACAIPVIEQRARPRSFIPLAVACFAMLSVLAYGGAVWLVVLLAAIGVFALWAWSRSASRLRLAGLVAISVLLGVGLVRGGLNFVHANGGLTGGQLGNLLHPLSGFQLFGIWPAGDFRVDPPAAQALTYVLIAIAIGAGLLALLAAWRRRSWFLWLYVAGGAVGIGLVSWQGSPWVQGKAIAIASPAAVFAALVGALVLLENRSRGLRAKRAGRAAGLLAVAAISAGVIWSNALAYHHATLAPYTQFRELQHIGDTFAGQGPTLLNEYQPYGARHFLRRMAPESPSELRRRTIPLLSGQILPEGGYADLDQFQLSALLVYRTIVTRTSPVASRPPQPYRLVYVGRWYEVWQRPTVLRRPVLAALPLGNQIDPTGVPDCGAVLRLARSSPRPALLAAASQATPVTMPVPSPLPEGDTLTRFTVPAPGRYEVWLGGSFIRRLQVYVDGARVASWHEQLNEAGQWTPLGTARLRAGTHRLRLAYGDAALYPGSGGPGAAGPFFAVGPLALAPVPRAGAISYVEPAAARSLCGRRWDWIEALG